MTVHNHSRIAPFGHLRVKGHLHLTAAFRSLSRPSSADIAKASTVCSYYLSLCKIHTLTFLAFKISLDLLSFLRYVGKIHVYEIFLSYLFFYTVFKEQASRMEMFVERMILSKLSSTLNNRCPTSPHGISA